MGIDSMNMSLIINTHWDREYRWSFSETQYRLVEAVDDLIDIMRKDEKFAFFHTDSQVSMLDDYLEARPEQEEAVKKLVSEGRLLTGPWYTLPAEFLVNGESLVRNLQLGHKISGDLGKTMKAAYNIFSWGQVSQLPQIYRQFGMNTIIFYRGIDQSGLKSLEFCWKGADGKESLALTFGSYHRLNFWHYVYLPYIRGKEKGMTRDGLGRSFLTDLCGTSMPEPNHWLTDQEIRRDFEAAREGLDELIETVRPKSATGELLFLQGFDQENPDPIVTELVEKLNETIQDGTIEITSLERYLAKVNQKLTPEKRAALPERTGEMLDAERCGDPYGPLYNGVFSARMPIKLKNAAAEQDLIYGAEPAAAWGYMTGLAWPSRMLAKAWKELLKNQQHDGIGGCHVDRVTGAMSERYQVVQDIARTVIKKTLKEVTAKIDYSFLEEKQIGLTVYNTLAFSRSGIVSCFVDVPQSWGLRYSGKGRREISVKAETPEGTPVPVQLLYTEDDTIFSYLKYGNVFSFDAARCFLLLELLEIPASGYVSLRLTPERGEDRPKSFLSPRVNTLENEALLVTIQPNGSLKVTDKRTGTVMDPIHYFEDTSEKGGPLSHSPAGQPFRLTTLTEPASAALICNGPLQASYRITYRWKLPKKLEAALKIHVPHGSEWVDQGRLKRSDEVEELVIVTDVTLKKGSGSLEFHTVVHNNILDHRLRVMFETGRKQAAFCRTDAPFDVVKRRIAVPDSSGWYEAAVRTWPGHSFVSVEDPEVGACVYHRGIPEYEVTDDETRTIALTLLRCFGNAGNPTEGYEYQELAQCQGKQEFDYLFEINPPEVPDAELVRRAQDGLIPCLAVQTTGHAGNLESKKSFLKTDQKSFIITSVTEGRDPETILVRGYNASLQEVQVGLTTAVRIWRAEKQTLEGKRVPEENCFAEDSRSRDLPIECGHTVRFSAGKKEIVTVCLKLGESEE